ncbi:YrdB family protein [Marinactinospora thermotolerans]|uniref:Uncharacterized protein n=1 Tax=Marinactinospora thermotolerans DSM 45154 TaxID=1122192 RepID=A0A1T4TAL5_9ACTN|nr:YrdB family protein [Marinactinospora thermotolerans]SKA37371.1 Protein of unknown function [Marinactinospora thermotolerans DSM 45154]
MSRNFVHGSRLPDQRLPWCSRHGGLPHRAAARTPHPLATAPHAGHRRLPRGHDHAPRCRLSRGHLPHPAGPRRLTRAGSGLDLCGRTTPTAAVTAPADQPQRLRPSRVVARALNSTLRFTLELCAMVALAFWGFEAGDGIPGKVGLAMATPLMAAVAWAMFVAPGAEMFLPLPGRLLIELLVFGGATAGLAAIGEPVLAGVFGALAVGNSVLVHVWRQDVRTRPVPL